MIYLAVFASGAGSNAQKIIEHFNKEETEATVSLVVCNKKNAGVLQVAAAAGVPTLIIERERFTAGDGYTAELRHRGIDLIVLAGFLWKVPLSLIEAYPRRIVNIHPALLPKWGGKGMYGTFVHEAVIGAAEAQSGITIHYVDEHYDHGDTIFQATCPVLPEDTAESLAKKVHELEHRHYPAVIEKIVKEISRGAY
jgi:phosphoribosylglycinamide formyltransferase 1